MGGGRGGGGGEGGGGSIEQVRERREGERREGEGEREREREGGREGGREKRQYSAYFLGGHLLEASPSDILQGRSNYSMKKRPLIDQSFQFVLPVTAQ